MAQHSHAAGSRISSRIWLFIAIMHVGTHSILARSANPTSVLPLPLHCALWSSWGHGRSWKRSQWIHVNCNHHAARSSLLHAWSLKPTFQGDLQGWYHCSHDRGTTWEHLRHPLPQTCIALSDLVFALHCIIRAQLYHILRLWIGVFPLSSSTSVSFSSSCCLPSSTFILFCSLSCGSLGASLTGITFVDFRVNWSTLCDVKTTELGLHVAQVVVQESWHNVV